MHTEFLQQAIDLAENNVHTGNGGPFGAILCRDEKIIATCSNNVTYNNDPTAHAEIMAIRAACTELNTFQLTEIFYGSWSLARGPGPLWARFKKGFISPNRYDAAQAGFDDGFIYEQIAMRPEKRKIPMQHLQLNQSLNPFIAWRAGKKNFPFW
ncbi:MAG: nucleoside deaminase [Candidatus Methanofishera endochildressiae]|uniref:Nucleoside deaminase n=1 Tax=Candidatus Methanofishera endochildressiae TaxID=2738884 RepID=A0A7Z0MN52_9GAMM|nr:nucleoside deaminase [Candidatus Methanofishera endochildressiae]